MVAGDSEQGRLYGAQNLNRVDLWNTGNATLVQLLITGNLGEYGYVVVDTISGGLSVGGSRQPSKRRC